MNTLTRMIIGALSALTLGSGALAQPAYHAPHTSFGDPDLQGLWTNASITSSTAPGIARLVITPAEAARLEKANKLARGRRQTHRPQRARAIGR
jgi:hypothetical protein